MLTRSEIFFNAEGKVIPYKNFVDKYNISNFPFTLYYGIICAIPSTWKTNVLASGGLNLNECQLLKFQLTKRSSKFVYKSILSRNVLKPKALVKWENYFANICYTLNWKFIFTTSFISSYQHAGVSFCDHAA